MLEGLASAVVASGADRPKNLVVILTDNPGAGTLGCSGHDALAKVVSDLLRAREERLALAETATGGMLANAFTGVHDAGRFFAGVVVCCSNDAKMQLLDGPECLLKQHRAVRKVGRGFNVGPCRDLSSGRSGRHINH